MKSVPVVIMPGPNPGPQQRLPYGPMYPAPAPIKKLLETTG